MTAIKTGNLLSKIRALFDSCAECGGIDAYIVFSNDRHMSEYCSESDQRRKFITGFGGSAGTAVITRDKALLWTDSRYHIEAKRCLDENWNLMKDGLPKVPKLIDWLSDLPVGYRIGTDPSLISYDDWESFYLKLKMNGKLFIPVTQNLVDAVWEEIGKPKEILNEIYVHDLQFAGVSWQQKVSLIREKMKERSSDLLVLSALDEIAWLFNLRGSDIHCCPVFKSFSLVTLDNLYLFVDVSKLGESAIESLNVRKTVASESVSIYPYASIDNILKDVSKSCKKIWINSCTPKSLTLKMPENFFVETNPVTIEKSIKNHIELNCIKRACLREAAVLCEFFAFLEKNLPKRGISEIQASDILSSMRSKLPNFVMNSFDTIFSSGLTGAIIHYRPTAENSRVVNVDEMILCDTGGNYLDGTTDITRTFHFGNPSDFEKECYTRVLKAHIAVATAKFPENATGSQIDGISRKHLWEAGLSFQHGIGHGIGMFLNVHEGPISISPKSVRHPFVVGNLLSNEPGFYLEGKYGIRIESMITVIPFNPKYDLNNDKFLQFETISLVPMHRILIDPKLLTQDEIDWLNDFHSACLKELQPELEKFNFLDGLEYLRKNTIPF